MKTNRILIILIIINLIWGSYLLFSYDFIMIFGLEDGFYILLSLITVFVCLILMIILRLKRRETPSKFLKIRSVIEIILCAVPTVFLGILLTANNYRTYPEYLTSPDGKHIIIRTTSADILGTSKYNFYQRKGLITYAYEFDAGLGDNLPVEWQENGFVYRQKFHPYLDYPK